jgi:hypothetical protein
VRTLIVTDPLDDLLGKACQPSTEQLHAVKLRQAMNVAFADAKAEAGPRRTPNRSRSRAAGAVLGLGLLVAGVGAVPAFAEWVGLRTGTYDVGPSSAFSPKAPERELWRMDSPELVPQLQAWTIDYPLAPGYTLAPLIQRYASAKNTQMAADSYRTDVGGERTRGPGSAGLGGKCFRTEWPNPDRVRTQLAPDGVALGAWRNAHLGGASRLGDADVDQVGWLG